jgi:peptidoglycan/LPS O-acetylase OafA/YrhL
VIYYRVFVVVLLIPRAISALLAAAIAGVIFATFRPGWLFNLVGLYAFWLAGLMLSRNAAPLQRLVVATNAPRFWTPTFLHAASMATGAWLAILKVAGIHAGLTFIIAINGVLLFDVFASVLGRAIARPCAAPFYALSAASTALALAYACYAGTIATMASTAVALGFFVLAGLAAHFRWRAPTPAQWAKLSAIGAVSYALYVIHFPIPFAAKAWCPGSWIAVLLAVPASLAAAAVLEGMLQPRIRRWSARISGVARRIGADVFSGDRRGAERAREASPRLPAAGVSTP